MASTYTPDLRLNKQGVGENNNTWGTIVNTQLDLLDDSISGMVALDVTTGIDLTLSTANGTTDQARKMILKLAGTPIADINVIVPAVTKIYIVNASGLAGSFSVSIKPTGSGTGVEFSAGECGLIACDGTDMILISKKQDNAPTGDVKIFYGTIASALINYPGYQHMDGTNGTPDTRNKYIIGASQDSGGNAVTDITGSLTQSGGSKDSVLIAHTHTANVSDPGHEHPIDQLLRVGNGNNYGGGTRSMTEINSTSSATTGITVTNTTTGTGDGTNANLPPYFALVYLMKV